jgi:RNA polymerase sigma-70 factor (ECF subfamily)
MNLTRWRITDQLRKRPRAESMHLPSSGDTARTATIDRVPAPQTTGIEADWNQEWEKNLVAIATDRVKRHAKPEAFQMFDLLVNKRCGLESHKRLHVTLIGLLRKYKSSLLKPGGSSNEPESS